MLYQSGIITSTNMLDKLFVNVEGLFRFLVLEPRSQPGCSSGLPTHKPFGTSAEEGSPDEPGSRDSNQSPSPTEDDIIHYLCDLHSRVHF